ncbi:MAG: hypothetical protein HQK56_11030 [Deltaproteobacteria bacterium]|nr:hypothetical protein [Deltaproteobacteria bacterium]
MNDSKIQSFLLVDAPVASSSGKLPWTKPFAEEVEVSATASSSTISLTNDGIGYS